MPFVETDVLVLLSWHLLQLLRSGAMETVSIAFLVLGILLWIVLRNGRKSIW